MSQLFSPMPPTETARVTPSSQAAVVADGVTKIYSRDIHDARTLKEILMFRAMHASGSRESLTALRDVSFEASPGEVIGVIGANAAGKSTLLKLLAGITPPTSGTLQCRGRVGSLLELGAGFQPDLSGMENIYLSAAVLGIERALIDEVLDDIIDFAELRPFIYTPVKHYSSGMYIRLGFSVAVHLRPDVLLIDEVLSVGDARFQRAGFERLVHLREGGTTAVIVSHNLHSLEALCDRVLWIERGEVRGWGPTTEVLRDHRRSLRNGRGMTDEHRDTAAPSDATDTVVDSIPAGRVGTGEMTIDTVRILGPDGQETQTLEPDQPFALELDYTAHRQIGDADINIVMEQDSLQAVAIKGHSHGFATSYPAGRGTIRADFPHCSLNAGSYLLSVALLRDDRLGDFARHFYDFRIRLQRFAVHSPAPASFTPLLRLPVEFVLKTRGA